MKLTHNPIALLFVAMLMLSYGCQSADTITIEHLTCEYLATPMGIEGASPRLGWELKSAFNGESQTAYQIIVSDTEQGCEDEDNVLWNTGKVNSRSSNNIAYEGAPFVSGQRYWWKVKVWNASGEEQSWSALSWFETGLLTMDDWQASKWIGLATDNRPDEFKSRGFQRKGMTEPRMVTSYPSPLLRKAIHLEKDVKQARAYVAGLGYNEFFVNGERMGDAVLNPGQTSYDKRAYYDVYDVTEHFTKGDNTVGVMLGNGFYGQNIAFGYRGLNYGQPALRFILNVEYNDGSKATVVSDDSWQATTSPIVFDNVYAGETYDARREKENWCANDASLAGWEEAKVLANVKVPVLTAQLLQPIKKIEYMPVVHSFVAKGGVSIYDIGQNISGWARIKVNEPAGTKIAIRYAEILSEDKQALDPATTGPHATGFVQTEVYICKGSADEVWEPRFTYHGFRYMSVEGVTNPDEATIDACMVRTAVEKDGEFTCSDELLNRIYETSMWTIEDNLHSVPEDCPHREKCAWLGDAHTSVEVMNFNYDMRRMWIKFVKDVVTNHGTGGRTYFGRKASPGIPTNIAVGRRTCQEARPDWGAATVLIPWNNYLFYNDTRTLDEHYVHMERWMAYLQGYVEDGLLPLGYGDWCHVDWKGRDSIPTSTALTSTAYYYYSLNVMSEVSQLLDKPEKAQKYQQEAVVIKQAFNASFLDETLMTYGSQTANAVALDMGLVPAGQEKAVAASLANIELTQKHDGHFTPGVHGMKRLFTMLSDYGYEDEVFEMLRKEDFPSFNYMLERGFTTWPESFQNYETHPEHYAKGSHNHPMQSAFAMWFHQHAGGLKPCASTPAFEHFTIKPLGYRHLTFVNASYHSIYGDIRSDWKVDGAQFMHTVEVPVNTTAMLYVPTSDKDAVEVKQAHYGPAKNVEFKGYEDGFACYLLSSGVYDITSQL